MNLYKETTNWKADYQVPNHYYILHYNRCYGYVRAGTHLVIRFEKPLSFDSRGRTFEKVMEL